MNQSGIKFHNFFLTGTNHKNRFRKKILFCLVEKIDSTTLKNHFMQFYKNYFLIFLIFIFFLVAFSYNGGMPILQNIWDLSKVNNMEIRTFAYKYMKCL